MLPRGRACCLLVIALALPALLLSTSLSLCNTELDSDLMVVRFVCLACEDVCPARGPTYFTSYQAAAVHVARSPRCKLSQKKIATVVLPNRPADNEAGGSGAAGAWTGQNQNQRRQSDVARPCLSGSGTSRAGPTYLMI